MISAYSIFCNIFDSPSVNESVLDYPNGNSLDSKIWDKDDDSWTLKSNISSKIKEVSEYIASKLKLKNPKAFIVGSICTNSYSDDSDIDLHIEVENLKTKSEDFMHKLNKKARDEFKSKFEGLEFGGHSVEIYIQNNKFQDMGSRGAYDVDNDEWIAEPTIMDSEFDPYEEYFEKSIDSLEHDDLISKASKVIFDAGIISNVIINIKDNGKFLEKMFSKLEDISKRSKEIFDLIRLSRKTSSTPKNEKDSEKMRKDKKWNINDAAFKLMGNIGVLAILKDVANIKDAEGDETAKAKYVLNTIKTNLFA